MSSGASSASLVVRTQKRRGGALSCAECRRLKLKCTRLFPCNNCVKKGCGAICPDGSLTTGKGNRFVLANTEALHEKISVLATRVRELEDGLSHAHSLTSSHIHPLLSDELLQIKRPLERERSQVPPQDEKAEVEEATTSLGSLSISNDGRAAYFGLQANSWYLLQIEESSDDEDYSSAVLSASPRPSDIPWLSHAFPFSAPVGVTAEGVKQTIMDKLPQMQVARSLCDIYYRHAAWMYTPINEVDFHVIFRQIYDPAGSQDPLQTTNLAVFCMVLALGALVDPDRPAHSSEAMLYYHLGRAVLSIESILEEHSLASIQVLLLMCHFMFLEEMSGPRWVLMGMAVKVAQSIGLHRDTGKWKVDPEQTQKRRELFYELLTYDSWQSLTYGRPPSFSVAHVDNQMPHPTTKNENGEVEMSYCAWKHRFASQCLSIVHDQAFGARPPNYKLVRELDKKVRDWYIPPSLQVPGFGSIRGLSTTTTTTSAATEPPTIQLTMQRYIVFAIREITLFYMHRGFFAQALRDNPADPMGSKYSHSVLAAYNSATSFVNLVESLFNQHPLLTERMWFLFTHVFSCSLVLGEIAMKPNMVFARSALLQLKAAYHLFSRVSDTTRTSKILPILEKLKENAQLALMSTDDSGRRNTSILSNNGSSASAKTMKIKSEVDDISALGGMTRLVTRRGSSTPSVVSASSPTSTSGNNTFTYTPDSQSPGGGIGDSADPSYVDFNDTTGMPAGSGWQNHTHVQNFNVNINMNMARDYYPGGNVGMATMSSPTSESSMHGQEDEVLYSRIQNPTIQQPRHHHHYHHLHTHQLQVQSTSSSSGGMASGPISCSPVAATGETIYMPFYGNPPGSGVGGYGQPHYFGGTSQTQPQRQVMQQGMVLHALHMQEQSPTDLNDSWQHFMAQYKS